jgi:Protein of unknown function (DUF2975)
MTDDSPGWVRLSNYALEAVVAVGLLLVGLFKVLFPLLGAIGPLPVIVDTRAVIVGAAATSDGATASAIVPPDGGHHVDVVAHLPAEAVTLHSTGHAELVFHHPGFGDRLLLIIPGLIGSLLLCVILSLLLTLARAFREGDIFVPTNTRRLLVIAGALLLIGTIPPALDILTTNLLVAHTPWEQGVSTPYAMSTTAVFGALLTATAATAFRQGSALRADTEGLV